MPEGCAESAREDLNSNELKFLSLPDGTLEGNGHEQTAPGSAG
jgi:hypothetical protein